MGGTICRCRSPDQLARSLVALPWFFVKAVLKAVNETEDLLGRPANIIEIYCHATDSNKIRKDLPVSNFGVALLSIFREDMVYTDDTIYYFTTRITDGYMNFSQQFRRRYPGYTISKDQTVAPLEAKTINFKAHAEMLKSTDESLMKQHVFDGNAALLDGGPLGVEAIGMTGFPRSGTSFTRKIIEQVTGLATGSTVHLYTGTLLQV